MNLQERQEIWRNAYLKASQHLALQRLHNKSRALILSSAMECARESIEAQGAALTQFSHELDVIYELLLQELSDPAKKPPR